MNEIALKDALSKKVMEIFEKASTVKIGLSKDDSDYSLVYLGQKLAQCSWALESLSDAQTALTRIRLQLIHTVSTGKSALKSRETLLRRSPEYGKLLRSEKMAWLREKLEDDRTRLEEWIDLERSVLEVKEAISEMVRAINRANSDIRLHERLLEAKKDAGAGLPTQDGLGGEVTSPGSLDME